MLTAWGEHRMSNSAAGVTHWTHLTGLCRRVQVSALSNDPPVHILNFTQTSKTTTKDTYASAGSTNPSIVAKVTAWFV